MRGLIDQRRGERLAPKAADVYACLLGHLHGIKAWRLAVDCVNAGGRNFDIFAITDETSKEPFCDRTSANISCADKENAFHDWHLNTGAFQPRSEDVQVNLTKPDRGRQGAITWSFPCRFSAICVGFVIPRMLIRSKFISFVIAVAGSVIFLTTSDAQTVTSDPVGFTTASSLSNSDTLLSIPFTRPPEFTGAIQSVSGSIITVAGTPGWTNNQFVYNAPSGQIKTYFALIGAGGASNPKEGHIYFVSANGANTLTVDTSADNLSGIVVNTQVILIPYWTPATIFPATDANVSFTPTTATATYKTQVLVPNNAANGINLPVTTYFFSNNVNGTSGNVGWRLVGDNTTDHGNDPLSTNSYFVVRNMNNAPTLPLKGIGGVLTKKLATALRTSVAQSQDNAVSMVRPVDVTLNQSGLGPSDGSFVATPPMLPTRNARIALKDQLLVFDNSVAAFDKQPAAIYYYSEGPGKKAGWKLFGDGSNDHGDDIIPAGSAIIIRKATTAAGQTVFWTNAPTY